MARPSRETSYHCPRRAPRVSRSKRRCNRLCQVARAARLRATCSFSNAPKGSFMTYAPANSRYDSMQYRRCGRSGLLLPAISLGLWLNFGGVDSFENGQALLRRAFDLGITHFDLANNYGPPPGSAEANFGRILQSDFAAHRDELIISTKAGWDMWPGPYGDW